MRKGGIVASLVFIALCGLYYMVQSSAPAAGKRLNDWAMRMSQRAAWKIEDGTGVELDPAQIKWDYAEIRPNPSGGKERNCQVTVDYRNSHLEALIEDLPCDSDGIPLEVATARVDEAVARIKESIRQATKSD